MGLRHLRESSLWLWQQTDLSTPHETLRNCTDRTLPHTRLRSGSSRPSSQRPIDGPMPCASHRNSNCSLGPGGRPTATTPTDTRHYYATMLLG